MGECICSSKKHGHGDVCRRPTVGDRHFCGDCEQQLASDRITQSEPNLARRDPLPTTKK
jgi:hypothetical protein